MAIDCTSAVATLGDFIHCVSELRKAWGLPKHRRSCVQSYIVPQEAITESRSR